MRNYDKYHLISSVRVKKRDGQYILVHFGIDRDAEFYPNELTMLRESKDEPRYIQIQNVKSKMWKKIDKKRGAIIGSSAKPYKNIPIVSSVPKGIKNIYKENKKEKFVRTLSEFKAEIIATNEQGSVANIAFATGTGRKTYRAEKTEKGWMIKGDVPPVAKAEVLDVLRYVGKNIKAFAKDDVSTWDIVSGGTGIEVIDDSGKRYKLAFRKKR